MDSTPEWSDLIAEALDERLDSVWTSLVGQITAYDAATCTATIQPLNKFRHVGEDGNVIVETIAPMQSVPVLQVSGGPFVLSMPVAAGDLVLVIVTSQFMGSTQIDGGASDSGHIGLNHNLESTVAITGLFSRQGSRAPRIMDTDGVVLGSAGGPVIKVMASDVRLGSSSATQAAILGNAFMTAMDTLLASISSAVGTIPGGSTAAADITAAAAAFNSAASGFLSAIVKLV